MDDSLATLFKAAEIAQGNAYAPYSNFKVGAAILANDGHVYAGANVENVAYPQGQCAEASAIGAMVTGGGRRIVAMVVVGPRPVTPCGGCRQRIGEFADAATPIHVADRKGLHKTFRFATLLPAAFDLAGVGAGDDVASTDGPVG